MLLAGVKKEIDINVFFVSFMLLVYAFLSSSTPDNLGVPEVFIAFVLVFLVFSYIFNIISIESNMGIFGIYYLFFLYMLIIPSIYGVVFNLNSIGNFIRDFIPLLYFFLPIFFLPFMQKDIKGWIRLLSLLLLIVAASYSVRYLIAASLDISMLGQAMYFGDMNYFPMDPAVIFGATYGILMGLELLIFANKKSFMGRIAGLLIMFMGILAYISLVAIMLRAQILLVLLSVLVYVSVRSRMRPISGLIFFLPLIGGFIYYAYDFVEAVYLLMKMKFETVGVSGRDAEIMAVINNASHSFLNLLFGEGWGGLISNPIGHGEQWRFVHNSVMYFLFKGGLPSMLLEVWFFGWFFYTLLKYVVKKIDTVYLIYLLSILNAISVNVVLEAGYKMLSFGVILTIFFLIHVREKFLLKKHIE